MLNIVQYIPWFWAFVPRRNC